MSHSEQMTLDVTLMRRDCDFPERPIAYRPTLRKGVWTLLLAICATSIDAADLLTARLVADANPYSELNRGGLVGNLITHADRIFFSAPTGLNGQQHWWSTDGSSTGLRLESALNQGPGEIRSLVSSGGPLYAIAKSGTDTWHVGALAQDGSAARWSTGVSTHSIDAYGFGSDLIYRLEGNLFLVRESDLQVSQLTQGMNVAQASPVALGSRLLFIDDGAFDTLWETDGTSAGTRPVASLAAAQWLHVSQSTVADGRYWALLKGCGNFVLVSSDGTAAGTRQVLRVTSGACPGPSSKIVVKDGFAYFFEHHQSGAPAGTSMWKSDGTQAGTVQIGTIDRRVSRLMLVGDRLVLTAESGGLPEDFYRVVIQGNSATFEPILALGMPVQANPEVGAPPFLSLNGKVLFGCGDEFCAMSHEDNSLHALATAHPLASNRSVSMGGKAYFRAGEGESLGLWASDGTPQTTSFVTATVATSDSGFPYPNDAAAPVPHQVINGRLVVLGSAFCPVPAANCPTSFLLSTRGTPISNALLEPSGDAQFHAIAALDDQLYFTAGTSDQSFLYSASPQLDGVELRASNVYGSADFLMAVPQVSVPFVLFGCSRPQSGITRRGACAFIPSSGAGQQWVWPPDNRECFMRAVGSIGETGIFFSTCGGQRSLVAATADVNSGVALGALSACPDSLQELEGLLLGERLYFCAQEQSGTFGLWRTDGSPSGTERLAELPGPASGFVRHQDGLVFRAGYAAPPGMQVLRFDSLAGDLAQLLPVSQGAISVPALIGSRLHWVESMSPNNKRHWVSDGTVAGTGVAPAMDSLIPTGRFTAAPAGYGSRWKGIFPCRSPQSGDELCATDELGTERRLAVDLVRGSGGSAAGGLINEGTKLYFLADDGRRGTELYVADPDWITMAGFELEDAL